MSDPPADLVAFCNAQFPRLVGALGLYCGDRDIAEDLAQEALVRVCRDWKKVRKMSSPEAWAHRVGMNLAHSYFRRRGAEKRATERLERVGAMVADTPTSDRIEQLEAIRHLPHRQRTALILRYYLAFTVPEIARTMECPEGTVKTLIHRGVRTLGRGAQRVEAAGACDAS